MTTTTIEELKSESFGLVANWLSRPEINCWLTTEWRDREVNSTTVAMAVRNKRNRLFLVRHVSEPCGLVALADFDPGDRTAMVWYFLGVSALSRRGITSAAVQQLSGIAFAELGLAVLYAWIMEGNVASRLVLEKSGFRICGRIRDAASYGGKQVNRIYFDLTPSDL